MKCDNMKLLCCALLIIVLAIIANKILYKERFEATKLRKCDKQCRVELMKTIKYGFCNKNTPWSDPDVNIEECKEAYLMAKDLVAKNRVNDIFTNPPPHTLSLPRYT